MATAAGDGGFLLRGPLEASISGSNFEIDRRPYHRNCRCPLHGAAKHCHRHHNPPKISFPLRRSWSEGSLALYAAAGDPSPSSSPAVAGARPHHLPPPHPNRSSSHYNLEDLGDDLFHPNPSIRNQM